MKVPFYGHVRQYHNIQKEIDSNMQEVLESGNYVMGPCSSGLSRSSPPTTAPNMPSASATAPTRIWLAFMALGIGPGRRSHHHPNTFFATAEAIWIAGATAVFVDCDPKTNCIDPTKIEAAITPKTKAIIPVHLYGQCADMPAIRAIADKHKLLRHRRQRAGHRLPPATASRSASSATPPRTSFIIQKNLGTFGDGGALVTNNPEHRPQSSAGCATTAPAQALLSTATASTAAWTTSTPRILSAKLKHIDALERPAPPVGRPLHAWPEGRARTSRCPTRSPATATSFTSTSSRRSRPEMRDQLLGSS